MSAWLPLKVKAAVPLAPPLIEAAPCRVTFKHAVGHRQADALQVPSTSLTVIPLIAKRRVFVDALRPGTLFTGASLTAVIDSVVVARLLASAPSLAVNSITRPGGVGVLRGVVVGHRPQHLLVMGDRVGARSR